MKVCIAEKPSVAKEIAQVLGAAVRHDGYYEGNGYQVTWTFGHFCTLLPPQDYFPKWKRWDIYSLPMLPERFETKVMDNDGVKKQFNTIKKLFSNADLVINCGDAGQEGELIQRWVIKAAEYTGEVQRLWISSLTSEAIETGFESLKPASDFDNLFYAGSSRAIGDWLLGMNATRLYTLKYGGNKQVLSIGRVQTPTLAILVQRHHEIENFKPQPYWELQTLYRETPFSHTEGKFQQKEDGEKVLKQILDKDLFITNIERKEGKEYAPKLFDLTGLQVYCNNKFGYSADDTLKLVQKLYEMKVVTYPRVDTTFLPNDMYPKVPNILRGLTKYSQFTADILTKKIRKSTKVFNDKKVTDHHAIIPTGEEKLLNAQEQNVYDIIVRRFIAVFLPDCKVAKTTASAEVETIEFVAKGKEILEAGWRILFGNDKDGEAPQSKSEDDTVLPNFEKGEHGEHQPQFIEKTTKAPSFYTEASLLRAMETAGKHVDDDELRDLMKANGIGRPSTRANIIETLFKRNYTERRKKQVIPTQMGILLINTIQNELLKSAELTGQWEKQLKEIEDGEYSAATFINNMKTMVHNLVLEVRAEKGKPIMAQEVDVPKPIKKASESKDVKCPKCQQGDLLKGKSAYGCSRWKEGCDLRIPLVFEGKKLTDNQILRLVKKGSTTKIKGFLIEGAKTEGTLTLDDNFRIQLKVTEEKESTTENSLPTCPKCKKGSLIKGKTAYGCNEWKQGCDFRFSFDEIRQKANGKTLTKELVMSILSSKE
jgi:DNA topoisomerase-3